MKILYAPIVVLLLALGCGEDGTCDSLNCDLPCEDFRGGVNALKLSCGCVTYCCDTCDGEQSCLDWCVDRNDP